MICYIDSIDQKATEGIHTLSAAAQDDQYDSEYDDHRPTHTAHYDDSLDRKIVSHWKDKTWEYVEKLSKFIIISYTTCTSTVASSI